MHTIWTSLALLITVLSLTHGQHYSKQEKGMAISLFQFDPATLGIYNHAQANHISHHGRGHLPLHVNPRRRKKIDVPPHKLSKDVGKNATNITNSTSQFVHKTETVKQLSKNPSPNQDDAQEHLTNVKFDGLRKNNTSPLLQPSNTTTLTSGENAPKANNTEMKLQKEELLFYRNKTNKGSIDHSEDINSVKLIKTTPPEVNQENVPILKEINATVSSSNATLNSKNSTSNFTTNFKNSTRQDFGNNATVSKPQNDVLNKSIASVSSAHFFKNETTVFDDKRKRNEILAQYIPVHKISKADRQSSFQAGSRKHLEHQMFPECYRCTKNSTYPECVRKSKILKCNEGLNNICFARSHKKKDNNFITYEMGCTNHKQCLKARAFPCRDGSKHCFTCCQFNRCNASPHHGVFETDDINLDELTKEKEKNVSANQRCNVWLVVAMVSVLLLVLIS